jgi:3-oxoacyl-[acyl-carrier-protein] synthase-3
MSIGLSRVAVQLPSQVEAVDDILARCGRGSLERRMFRKIHGLRDSLALAPGERFEDLLVAAGRAALAGETAGVVLYGHTLLIHEIDFGGGFRDRLRDGLGLPGAQCYGISHVNCTSVLRAVDLAGRYLTRIGASPDDRVLVLGGDHGSVADRARYIPGTTVAGDCVIAVVARPCADAPGTRYRHLGAASSRDVRFHPSMRLPQQDAALFGRACGAEAVTTVLRAVKEAGLEEVDWVMPHLSNRMFWRTFSAESGIPMDRICLDLLPERGHNFGTDALMALEHADRTGLLRPGDRCALLAIGQGAYFQSAIVEVTGGSE